MARAETRDHLQSTALQLFLASGYDTVPVTAIAAAAGVSHMTFFRYFPTKESIVVGDLFDPTLASAVAAQSDRLPPLHRAVRGLLSALSAPDVTAELGSPAFAQRLFLIAVTPSLRGAVWASSRATEDALVEALHGEQVALVRARAAAGAIMGAATAALLDWATSRERNDPAQALEESLTSLLDGVS